MLKQNKTKQNSGSQFTALAAVPMLFFFPHISFISAYTAGLPLGSQVIISVHLCTLNMKVKLAASACSWPDSYIRPSTLHWLSCSVSSDLYLKYHSLRTDLGDGSGSPEVLLPAACPVLASSPPSSRMLCSLTRTASSSLSWMSRLTKMRRCTYSIM